MAWGPAPRPSPRAPRLLRRAALGALATAAALRAWGARIPTAFTHAARCGAAAPLTLRHARKPGEAPGGASAGAGGLGSDRSPKKAAGIAPVVDDSDFGLEDAPSAGGASGGDKKESFDTLMKAADAFATKKERAKRKSRSNALALEDDMQGLSLEDDTDMSAIMMSRARTGKTDVSIPGRLTKWAAETKELITNPTPIQLTYVSIFLASAAFLVLIGVVTFALGAVRLRGDGLDVERRRQMTMQDPYIIRRAQMMDFKKRAMQVSDIKELGSFYGQPGEAPGAGTTAGEPSATPGAIKEPAAPATPSATASAIKEPAAPLTPSATASTVGKPAAPVMPGAVANAIKEPAAPVKASDAQNPGALPAQPGIVASDLQKPGQVSAQP